MWHTWERREMHTGILSENVKERDCWEDLGIDEEIILE
jgi:hypothetical protein